MSELSNYLMKGQITFRSLLSSQNMEAIVHGIKRHYSGIYDNCRIFDILDEKYLTWYPKGRDGEVGLSDYIIPISQILLDTVRATEIGSKARELMQSDSVRLFASSVVYKGPNGYKTSVNYHSDKAFWPNCSSSNMMTAWIPLEESTPENGTLRIVPSSHLDNGEYHQKRFFSCTSLVPRLETESINLSPGDVSFHHCLLVHGSGPNLSGLPRRALVLHLQDDANSFQRTSPKKHTVELLVRKTTSGAPDYKDPEFCPVL